MRAEGLQRLVLRRGGEGEEAQVRLLAPLRHRLQDFFLVVGQSPRLRPSCLASSLIALPASTPFKSAAASPGLRAVGLVHDHGIVPVGQVPDLVRDEGELLERGDDDGHAGLQGFGQLRRVLVDLLHDAADLCSNW